MDTHNNTISMSEAGNKLMACVDMPDFKDRVYEFAQDLCEKAINAIENQYDIDTTDCDENEMWYDEYRDDFIKAIFEKLGL